MHRTCLFPDQTGALRLGLSLENCICMFHMTCSMIVRTSDCIIGLLTIRRDFFPRVRWVHEGSVLYLLVDIFVFVEWEGSTEADVHDHSDAPHVQGPVVPFVA